MYTSYLMKVTSVFTWQKGLATINSLGSHNTPSCFVTIKSWSQASNQNLLCLDRMFFPLWNITGWKSMWPHPSCPSPLFVLPSLCSSRWIDLLNAVGGKKKRLGTVGLLGIRELLEMIWKSCVDLCSLGCVWFFKRFMIFQRVICPYIKLLTQCMSNHTGVAARVFFFIIIML